MLCSNAIMINLMGDLWFDHHGQYREPDWNAVLEQVGAVLHLYGKDEARVGRKMGHINVLADSFDAAVQTVRSIAARLNHSRVLHWPGFGDTGSV